MPAITFAPDIRAVAQIESVPMILRLVKHVTGMRFAAVARVTDKRWVTCAVDDSLSFGLAPGDELVLETTICHEIRQHRQPVVFGQASAHPLYASHHTPKIYKLESYVSIPIIRANGEFFGTLCAIDPSAHDVEKPETIETLKLFAQLIGANLDMQASVENSQDQLADAQATGRLRDQFIAVLGHDLRTPLSAIRMSADLLETKVEGHPQRRLIDAIRTSTQRMSTLIENVLDFARGRLGEGIPVKRQRVDLLEIELDRVIDEVRFSHPEAIIEQSMSIPACVDCDPVRVGQLLSNLLGNAVVHGDVEVPIHVQAQVECDQLVLTVRNQGDPIPAELMPQLFEPYTRSQESPHGEGLGLGLYIASQIMKGHGGSITVSSTAAEGTCFRASFPLQNS
ncbi:GAF domain-containing sensor histidine kinase [Pseudomonas capeferrum]|uniref:GAF domain-containing sensor histidine kinase n=1 Tax=Pseudomonas capeferrum TaxID=1495066 RepID=UPI0015E326B3|nr:GAF domain-containing sensor histidine kinase [Pseudomonas capeferrum]MBA1205409.1 GAF domain-containing sensor histidine kinase [Pseudomonas capeferrum]